MKELHDRINRVMHTRALEESLERDGIDLFDFQSSWCKLSKGGFDGLPSEYQSAILAGEQELAGCMELAFA